MRRKRRSDTPVPRHHLDHRFGNAGLVHELDSAAPDQGCLLRGLGDGGVAGGEGGRHRADEDRQGEIPGRNADENAASVKAQFVQFPCRARKKRGFGEQTPSFAGIIAEEIDCLADFEHGVGQCFPGFADAEREQFVAMLFE